MQNNPFFNNWQTSNRPQMFAPSRPTPPSPVLSGRIINDQNEVNAREVPMDGIGIFPQSDGSCIYVKTWNNNGTITTDRYILEQAQQIPTGPSEFDQVMCRLNKLEEMLVMINPDLKAFVEQPKLTEEVQK